MYMSDVLKLSFSTRGGGVTLCFYYKNNSFVYGAYL